MQGKPERGTGGRAVAAEHAAGGDSRRVHWVDYAKGICIIFVVMMHSTLGVEKAVGETGYMHLLVQFAKPFRMPDFFLISGLFLGLVIDRPWLRYLDRKVVHFFYFYMLWAAIQFAFKAPGWMAGGMSAQQVAAEWLLTFVEPFGTLWFIYLLPIFFVATRLHKAVPWPIVLGGAAILEMLPIHTGWTVPDEFASRYVYFLAGYYFAAGIFRLADHARSHTKGALGFLAVWGALNAWATFAPIPAALQGWHGAGATVISDLPLVSLALGAAGAIAIVTATALLSKLRFAAFLEFLGRNSIVVYLAFFLPMAVSRAVLLRFADFLDIGTISLLVTAAGVIGPVLLLTFVRITGFGNFLFSRPNWAHLEGATMPLRERSLHPAE
jgi:uncharacterized membrane protein YcfT